MAYRSTPVAAPLAAAIRQVITRFLAQLRLARAGRPGGVHQARVASRRLREVLPVMADCTRADVRDVRRDIRRLARALGRVRELDVLHTLLHAHPAAADWAPAVRHRVDRALGSQRTAAQNRLLARVAAVDVRSLARRLRAVTRQLTTPTAVTGVEAALDTRRRLRALALSRAVEQAGTIYAPSSLHAARIATKKLRYSLEWSRLRANPPAMAGQLAELKSLQEVLGHVQDLHTLQSTLRRIAGHGKLDRATLRSLNDAAARIETAARQQHAQFVSRMPAVLALTADLARTTPLSWIRRRPIRAGTFRAATRKTASN